MLCSFLTHTILFIYAQEETKVLRADNTRMANLACANYANKEQYVEKTCSRNYTTLRMDPAQLGRDQKLRQVPHSQALGTHDTHALGECFPTRLIPELGWKNIVRRSHYYYIIDSMARAMGMHDSRDLVASDHRDD